MSYEFVPGNLTGWECPRCGRVYSPWTEMCRFCGNGTTVTLNTYTATVNENTYKNSSVTTAKNEHATETGEQK